MPEHLKFAEKLRAFEGYGRAFTYRDFPFGKNYVNKAVFSQHPAGMFNVIGGNNIDATGR
jgi:hypothetical protein